MMPSTRSTGQVDPSRCASALTKTSRRTPGIAFTRWWPLRLVCVVDWHCILLDKTSWRPSICTIKVASTLGLLAWRQGMTLVSTAIQYFGLKIPKVELAFKSCPTFTGASTGCFVAGYLRVVSHRRIRGLQKKSQDRTDTKSYWPTAV